MNPQAKANRMVAAAKRTGALVPQPCEVCGAAVTVAHHDDYEKPLVVRWLCHSHHRKWHVANGSAAGVGRTLTVTIDGELSRRLDFVARCRALDPVDVIRFAIVELSNRSGWEGR